MDKLSAGRRGRIPQEALQRAMIHLPAAPGHAAGTYGLTARLSLSAAPCCLTLGLPPSSLGEQPDHWAPPHHKDNPLPLLPVWLEHSLGHLPAFPLLRFGFLGGCQALGLSQVVHGDGQEDI